MNPHHREAEQAVFDAERSLRNGDRASALAHLQRAALAEERALRLVGQGKPRTKGVLGVSAVSLAFRAENYEHGLRMAYNLLADEEIDPSARNQLRELADVLEAAIRKPIGGIGSTQSIDLVLMGRVIGKGVAPADIFSDYVQGIQNVIYRLAEHLEGSSLRKRGQPVSRIRDSFQALITEPVAGSFRFSIQLQGAAQLSLLPDLPTPIGVTAKLFEVIGTLDPIGQREWAISLQKAIPDASYREVILKILRNVIPDGIRISSTELSASIDGQLQKRVLHRGYVESIRRVLEAEAKPSPGPPEEIRGRLRAVHLDNNWLIVDLEDGEPRRCEIAREVYDDQIGPLLNREVRIRGYWDGHRRFNLLDVELETGNADIYPPVSR